MPFYFHPNDYTGNDQFTKILLHMDGANGATTFPDTNAGGVATSQLEMAQNSSMQQWSFEEVDGKLFNIMKNIYTNASERAKEFGQPGNLVFGANIAGFRRVADAMIDQGVM